MSRSNGVRSMLLSRGETTPPWGVPRSVGKSRPWAVASRLEHGPNQAQHPAIRYSRGHQREQFLVIHGPEKVSEIRIYDPLRPALYLLPHFAQGVLRRSPSPISKAGIIEYRLEDGLQPIEQCLLAHAIIDRRYAERSILTGFVPLRDGVLPYRSRVIGVLLQLALQPIQLLVQLRLESRQILPIYASTAPVRLHLFPGHRQVLPLVHLVD